MTVAVGGAWSSTFGAMQSGETATVDSPSQPRQSEAGRSHRRKRRRSHGRCGATCDLTCSALAIKHCWAKQLQHVCYSTAVGIDDCLRRSGRLMSKTGAAPVHRYTRRRLKESMSLKNKIWCFELYRGTSKPILRDFLEKIIK